MADHGHNSAHAQEVVAHANAKPNHSVRLKLGWIAFGLLLAIEIAEYIIGAGMNHGNWPILVALAVVGAWPILHYFMHISQLWRKDEEE